VSGEVDLSEIELELATEIFKLEEMEKFIIIAII